MALCKSFFTLLGLVCATPSRNSIYVSAVLLLSSILRNALFALGKVRGGDDKLLRRLQIAVSMLTPVACWWKSLQIHPLKQREQDAVPANTTSITYAYLNVKHSFGSFMLLPANLIYWAQIKIFSDLIVIL